MSVNLDWGAGSGKNGRANGLTKPDGWAVPFGKMEHGKVTRFGYNDPDISLGHNGLERL